MNQNDDTNQITYTDNAEEQNDLNKFAIRDKDSIFEDLRDDRDFTSLIAEEDKIIIETGIDPDEGHSTRNAKIDIDKSIDTQGKSSLDPNEWDSGDTRFGEPSRDDESERRIVIEEQKTSAEDLVNE